MIERGKHVSFLINYLDFPVSSPLSACYGGMLPENGVGLPSRSSATQNWFEKYITHNKKAQPNRLCYQVV